MKKRMSKLIAVKIFSQLRMLVDFEYLSQNETFTLEIWHTCYQHKDNVVPKISW